MNIYNLDKSDEILNFLYYLMIRFLLWHILALNSIITLKIKTQYLEIFYAL